MAKMKLHVMHHGKMWLDKSNVVAGSRLATDDNRNPPAEWTSIPVTSYYNIFGQESRAASPAFPPSRA